MLVVEVGARGWGGGHGTDRRTDSPCSVFSFSSVRRLVCLRAQTCSAPFEGYLKSGGFLVRLSQGGGGGGVDQACVWVVVMEKAEEGEKSDEGNMEEKGRMGASRPKIRV